MIIKIPNLDEFEARLKYLKSINQDKYTMNGHTEGDTKPDRKTKDEVMEMLGLDGYQVDHLDSAQSRTDAARDYYLTKRGVSNKHCHYPNPQYLN